MGLTQIDLIKQIYYFFRDFRERLQAQQTEKKNSGIRHGRRYS